MRRLSSFLITATTILWFSPAWAITTDSDPRQISAIVDGTTPAAHAPGFIALERRVLADLHQALQGGAANLTRPQLEKAKQSDRLANTTWLTSSGYDFATKQNQQVGIDLLAEFSRLSPAVLAQNLETVTRINRDATQGQREQALVDAEGQN